jgi:hypothetical protein
LSIAEARRRCLDIVLINGEDLTPYRAANVSTPDGQIARTIAREVNAISVLIQKYANLLLNCYVSFQRGMLSMRKLKVEKIKYFIHFMSSI